MVHLVDQEQFGNIMFPWLGLYVIPDLGLTLTEMVPHPYGFNECHQGKDANLANISFVTFDEERSEFERSRNQKFI